MSVSSDPCRPDRCKLVQKASIESQPDHVFLCLYFIPFRKQSKVLASHPEGDLTVASQIALDSL